MQSITDIWERASIVRNLVFHRAFSEPHIQRACLLSGSTAPYSELAPHYAQLRTDTEALMQHCRVAGLLVTGALAAGLTAEAAANIAAAVPNTVPGLVECTPGLGIIDGAQDPVLSVLQPLLDIYDSHVSLPSHIPQALAAVHRYPSNGRHSSDEMQITCDECAFSATVPHPVKGPTLLFSSLGKRECCILRL